MAPVDLIFENGHVLTQDPDGPRAEALAVAGDRIVGVGSRADLAALAGPDTRRVDLQGGALVPGFHDAHAHLWKVGDLEVRQLDLRGIASLDELSQRLREAHGRLPPGAWLLGRGYNEARFEEGREPSAADLDAAAPDRPVFLIRTCAHKAVASTAALRAAGIDAGTAAPPGGEIERGGAGEPTGRVAETALGLFQNAIPQPTSEAYAAMIAAASQRQLAHGITSTTDAGVPPALLAVYRDLAARGALRQRVNVMASRVVDSGGLYPIPEKHLGEWLRLDTVKLWADGGLSGATAALSVPYRHAPGMGILRLDEAEIAEHARAAHEAGLRVAVHVIGDRAIEVALRALEALPVAVGAAARLEHFGLPSPDHIERAARLGSAIVPQTTFLRELAENFRRYLPARLLERAYPLRALLDAGLRVALSSDAPVVQEESPLLGMQAAVLRARRGEPAIGAAEAIRVEEALAAYTIGGACVAGESRSGRLAPGCWADLAVLDMDPLGVEAEALEEIRVHSTWVGGKLAHEA